MSKVVNVGYTDTPISGVTALEFPRGLVNYGADFRTVSDAPGELVITNITSPTDRPEAFRFGYSSVADVYKGTSIDPSVFAPSRKGISLLVQLTDTYSVTDTTDAEFRVDLPISTHLVIKVPSSEYLTTAMIQTQIGRLVSGIFETGSEELTRLQALLRGSLKPSDL